MAIKRSNKDLKKKQKQSFILNFLVVGLLIFAIFLLVTAIEAKAQNLSTYTILEITDVYYLPLVYSYIAAASFTAFGLWKKKKKAAYSSLILLILWFILWPTSSSGDLVFSLPLALLVQIWMLKDIWNLLD